MEQKIESQIEDELSSLTLFDDVVPTLNALQSRSIRVGLCSNLAQPYGAVIDRLLADFDLEQFLSYELGTIKLEAHIYKSILSRFNGEADQCLFIGDTFEADYAGPIDYQNHWGARLKVGLRYNKITIALNVHKPSQSFPEPQFQPQTPSLGDTPR